MGSLDTVAETVLHRRYLQQDEDGEVVETPDEMFHRVAADLATAEQVLGESPLKEECVGECDYVAPPQEE